MRPLWVRSSTWSNQYLLCAVWLESSVRVNMCMFMRPLIAAPPKIKTSSRTYLDYSKLRVHWTVRTTWLLDGDGTEYWSPAFYPLPTAPTTVFVHSTDCLWWRQMFVIISPTSSLGAHFGNVGNWDRSSRGISSILDHIRDFIQCFRSYVFSLPPVCGRIHTKPLRFVQMILDG